MINMAGCVVLYNPPKTDNKLDVIENIKTYLPLVKKLYVMDNSTKIDAKDVEELKQIKKVEYISMNGNKGIAKALKDATELAIKEKFDYILTMDQDSKYPTEDFGYIEEYIKNNDMSQIGQLCLTVWTQGEKRSEGDKSKTHVVPTCITSGTILNLKNYLKVDGFNEDLFIDLVDFDISAQLTLKGYKTIKFDKIFLNHQLGKIKYFNFILFIFKISLWPPIRHYYIFRNYHYFMKYKSKKYKSILRKELKLGYGEIFARVFAYPKGKGKENYKMIKQGIKDGKAGKLGPYQEH